jgi:uncharacterized protein
MRFAEPGTGKSESVMHFDIFVALAGLIVGVAVGLTGMGGGALMTPVLVLIFGVQPLAAVSSDLVASLIMKPVGSAVHAGRHTVNWPLVRWLCLGSVPAAFLGVFFLHLRGRGAGVQNFVQVALGVVELAAVAAVIAQPLINRRRTSPSPGAGQSPLRVRRVATVAVAAVTGFVVGITSVGSGTLVIVMLLLLYLSLRGAQMVGTDLTQAIPMVGSAALAHILFGNFQLGLTASIIAGSIPGVLIGSLVSSRARTRVVCAALLVVLLTSALKLLGAPTAAVGVVLVVSAVIAVAAVLGRRDAVEAASPAAVKAGR